jgi:hypothetical protein
VRQGDSIRWPILAAGEPTRPIDRLPLRAYNRDVPRISEFLGIVIYMYFSEHNPPHFHAIYGQYEAEILIETREILKGKLPVRALSLVREWAEKYQDQLLLDWELARRHEELKQIPPLE